MEPASFCQNNFTQSGISRFGFKAFCHSDKNARGFQAREYPNPELEVIVSDLAKVSRTVSEIF
jgi:hypothetical protein